MTSPTTCDSILRGLQLIDKYIINLDSIYL